MDSEDPFHLLGAEISTTVYLLERRISVISGYTRAFINRYPSAITIRMAFVEARNTLTRVGVRLDAGAREIPATATDLIHRITVEAAPLTTTQANSRARGPSALGARLQAIA
jgi:hypothetical protein